MNACNVLAALELDGKQVNGGMACSAVCGSAVSLVCTLYNCTSQLLTDVTVGLQSVHPLAPCSASSVQSNAADRRAKFDDSVIAVGCLMSTFPQVSLLNTLQCSLPYSFVI